MHISWSNSLRMKLNVRKTKLLKMVIPQRFLMLDTILSQKLNLLPKRWSHIRWYRVLFIVAFLLNLLVACGEPLNQGNHTGNGPVPTARSTTTTSMIPLPLPSEPAIKTAAITDNSLMMAVVGDIAYAGTVDQGLLALRASDGSLLWRSSLEGAVTEVPVVENNVVYVDSYVGEIGPATITALRESDGMRLWTYHVNSYIYMPIVQNGVVYLTVQNAGVYALRASDGKQLWHFTGLLDQEPILDMGVLYLFSSGEGFYALRARDGKQLWHTSDAFNGSSFIVQNGTIFAFSEGQAYALHASDGHQLWSQPIDASYGQNPQLSDGVLYLVATKISLGTPTPVLTATLSPVTRSPGRSPLPVSLNTALKAYVPGVPDRKLTSLKQGKSVAYALRASDGQLLWQDRLNQGNDSFASAVQVDSRAVYVAAINTANGNSESIISVLRKQDGNVLWQRSVAGSISGALLAVDGLYLTVDFQGRSGVYALNALDGTLRWNYSLAGDAFNGLVLTPQTAYSSSTNGIAYALYRKNGILAWYHQTKGEKKA